MPVPSGFAVESPAEDRPLSFVDLEGTTRWRVQSFDHGCSTYPEILSASPSRLRVRLPIACDRHRGSAGFGDLSIADQTRRPEDPLGRRVVIVEMEMPSKRAVSIRELPELPPDVHFAAASHGIVAFGRFSGALGLGTAWHSRPPLFVCSNFARVPSDSGRGRAYPTERPSCPHGFRLDTTYPSWPFVAGFATR